MKDAKELAHDYWGRPQPQRGLIPFIREVQADARQYSDAEITELAQQIVSTASGVAIPYVPPELPIVIKIKGQLMAFLEVGP